jgi:hypothetical protein
MYVACNDRTTYFEASCYVFPRFMTFSGEAVLETLGDVRPSLDFFLNIIVKVIVSLSR